MNAVVRQPLSSEWKAKPGVNQMHETDENGKSNFGNGASLEQWPGIDSRFHLVIVAALRNKQLLRGSPSRIEADPLKRKNISIALEEVKRGLVGFSAGTKNQKGEADSDAA